MCGRQTGLIISKRYEFHFFFGVDSKKVKQLLHSYATRRRRWSGHLGAAILEFVHKQRGRKSLWVEQTWNIGDRRRNVAGARLLIPHNAPQRCSGMQGGGRGFKRAEG